MSVVFRQRAETMTPTARMISLATATALAIAGCGGGGKSKATTSAIETAAPSSHVSVFRLQSQITAMSPSARSARAAGSVLVFVGMLFQPNRATAIGRYQGSCVRTAPSNGDVFECLLTYIVKDGDIYAQSVSSSQGPADGAVTGGTGRYAGVHGTFQYKATGNPRVDLTFALVR
ncbi:MAG: hypothetical protein ACYDHH_25655 [Solirubrobacteraceae bacterium]